MRKKPRLLSTWLTDDSGFFCHHVLASLCRKYYRISVRVFVQEANQDTERSYPGQRERGRQGKFPGDRPQLSDRKECRRQASTEECPTTQPGDGENAPEAAAHVPEPLWSVSDDASSSLLVSVIEGLRLSLL